METKSVVSSSPDGTEITHNNFVVLDNTLLRTQQGVRDGNSGLNIPSRIGDEILLNGVKLSLMVELNERYTDVTFRMLVVKSAKGDTPTRDTLFNGNSGNKMIDSLNTERYTIIFGKTFKVTSRNATYTYNDSLVPPAPAGTGTVQSGYYSRATRIVKVWIPGNKFVKSRKIVYEHSDANTFQTKFFDYHCVLYAYSNYSTNQDLWNVGRVNDFTKQIYFKDA